MQDLEARRIFGRPSETYAQFWRATIVTAFFVIVFGASFFLGTVMVVGTFRGSDISSELTANGRAGRIARPLRDGTLCHYMVFDNKTAQTVEDRIGRCDESKPKPKPDAPARFTWGR
ncbi:MAG TPA: hypothetical protein VFB29_09010 [Pseudolabrys sp.]|nr:hypothetical protein [Pseudolabrys sp.]